MVVGRLPGMVDGLWVGVPPGQIAVLHAFMGYALLASVQHPLQPFMVHALISNLIYPYGRSWGVPYR
jgi:hypothetical protein